MNRLFNTNLRYHEHFKLFFGIPALGDASNDKNLNAFSLDSPDLNIIKIRLDKFALPLKYNRY